MATEYQNPGRRPSVRKRHCGPRRLVAELRRADSPRDCTDWIETLMAANGDEDEDGQDEHDSEDESDADEAQS